MLDSLIHVLISLNIEMDNLFAYFGFLNTVRYGNLVIDVLYVMTIRFWDDKY